MLSQARFPNFLCTHMTCLANDALYSEENEHCMHGNFFRFSLLMMWNCECVAEVIKTIIAQQQDTGSGRIGLEGISCKQSDIISSWQIPERRSHPKHSSFFFCNAGAWDVHKIKFIVVCINSGKWEERRVWCPGGVREVWCLASQECAHKILNSQPTKGMSPHEEERS